MRRLSVCWHHLLERSVYECQMVSVIFFISRLVWYFETQNGNMGSKYIFALEVINLVMVQPFSNVVLDMGSKEML